MLLFFLKAMQLITRPTSLVLGMVHDHLLHTGTMYTVSLSRCSIPCIVALCGYCLYSVLRTITTVYYSTSPATPLPLSSPPQTGPMGPRDKPLSQ